MSSFLYIRQLRHVDHSVFCVTDGQKTYYDAQFNKPVAYSSGQQVKRSILDCFSNTLKIPNAPITFNYNITKKDELQYKETWSPCDPTYYDQLLGGWMRAGADLLTVKRRSPLSVSAMRPLHPLLASLNRENITFDRSDKPDLHPARVMQEGKKEPLSDAEVEQFLEKHKRTLPRKNYIQDLTRTSGLFVNDIAIDFRTLFCVSLNTHERELSPEIIENLKQSSWVETKNVFGTCLVLPENERNKIIPALADAIINWRITSNQARTFSPMETLAIAISANANKIVNAIRAQLNFEEEQPKAKPVIEKISETELFVTPACRAYVEISDENHDALQNARNKIEEYLNAFKYEDQIN